MPRPYFRKAVTQKELTEGTIVEIDPDVQDSSSDGEEFDNEVGNSFNEEISRLATGEENIENDFSGLRLNDSENNEMTPLTEDGLVKKRVIKQGIGSILPAKSIIFMHYRACLEGSEKPYDSTYLRGRTHRFLLNSGSLIPGVEIAVKTMHKGEVACIWIHHSYAYREMGCPPRIPAMTNIVYTIEIVNFIDCKEAIEFEEMTPEDQKRASFEKIYAVSAAEHKAGTEMCENKRYHAAISRYQKAKRLLEDACVANEEEDEKRTNRLLKLYLNLAFCFLKLKNSKRTVTFCKKALDIDDNNVKALFRLGLGYMLDNDFDRASGYLHKAKGQQPYNQEINEALLELNKKKEKFGNWEKNFYLRMFHNAPKHKGPAVESLESREFIVTVKNRLELFVASPDTEYTVSSAYNQNQIEVIKGVAESLDLYFSEKIYDKQKIIKILKKNI